MSERTSAGTELGRLLAVARLGAMAAAVAVPIAVAGMAKGSAAPLVAAVPAAQEATPAVPPPDDIAATVSACLAAGVDFSDCVDATVAEIVPAIEASVPTEEAGATGEPPPPPVPVITVPPVPPLPLPLPPVLGGGTEDETDDEAEDE